MQEDSKVDGVQLFSKNSLSAKKATGLGLEGNYDNSQFQVTFFLQLCQHSCTEKYLAQTNPVQVGVQV